MTAAVDLADARDALASAAALGAAIPVPSGTVGYVAMYSDIPGKSEALGVFSTLDKAISALASRIRAVWSFDNSHHLRRTAPWVTAELYDQATTWRSPREDISEQQYSLMLTVATSALAQLRSLQSDWFADHDDRETVIAFLKSCSLEHIDADHDDLDDPLTWHSCIEKVQIDTAIVREFALTDPGR